MPTFSNSYIDHEIEGWPDEEADDLDADLDDPFVPFPDEIDEDAETCAEAHRA